MNIGNITSDNFNLDGNGKDIQIEVYEQLIEQLQQENKRLNGAIQTYDILLKANTEENKRLTQKITKALEKIEDYNLGKYDYSIPSIGVIELKEILEGKSK